MPTVPRYERTVSGGTRVAPAGLPSVMQDPNAPAGAFGGPSAALTEAAVGAANTAAKIFEREREKADQIKVLEAEQKLNSLWNDVQYHPQTGALTRKGKDVFGSYDQAKTTWDKGVGEIAKDPKSDRQRLSFQQRVANKWAALDSSIQNHVASESMKYDDELTAASLENAKAEASGSGMDPNIVAHSIAGQVATLIDYKNRWGKPDEWFSEKVKKVTSDTHVSVIENELANGNPLKAGGYFKAVKEDILPKDQESLQRKVDEKVFEGQRAVVWDKVKGMTLGDGLPDVEGMEKVVAAIDVPQASKEKLLDYVRAKAGEARVQVNQQRAARDRDFMNALVSAKRAGATLDDALSLASRFGFDEYDTFQKESAVKQLYSKPTETDPGVYMALWEGIQGNRATKIDIDNAMRQGKISATDWEGLRKEFYRNQTEATNPEMRATWERVKLLAESTYGKRKEKLSGSDEKVELKDAFLYEVKTAAAGKTPAETWKIANDKIQEVVTDKGMIWDTKEPAWKVELQNRDIQTLKMGQLYEQFGSEIVNLVGAGTLKKNWGVEDVDAFADAVGGYDRLRAGTAEYQAIEWLAKSGKIVTAANVKAVINHYGLKDK